MVGGEFPEAMNGFSQWLCYEGTGRGCSAVNSERQVQGVNSPISWLRTQTRRDLGTCLGSTNCFVIVANLDQGANFSVPWWGSALQGHTAPGEYTHLAFLWFQQKFSWKSWGRLCIGFPQRNIHSHAHSVTYTVPGLIESKQISHKPVPNNRVPHPRIVDEAWRGGASLVREVGPVTCDISSLSAHAPTLGQTPVTGQGRCC